MNVADQTIAALGSVITGNGEASPYRSGPDLVTFFNRFCEFPDEYGQGFPSRWAYAEDKLRELNGTTALRDALLASVDPRSFLGTQFSCETAADHLNQFLEYDGYELRREGRKWVVVRIVDDAVEVHHSFERSGEITHDFIVQQIAKSKDRLERGDYDGAITNARSLIEGVLFAIERDYDTSQPEYDGNLLKLYKRVQRHLNLAPGQEGMADSLRQILSGMASVVNGLASLRNRSSDSHVATYRAEAHHAQLAVNSARTLAQFLFDTREYQESKRKRGTA